MTKAVIGALRVNLGMSSAQFEKGLSKAQIQMNKFSHNAQKAFKGVAIGAAAAGVAVGAMFGKFLSASIAQEKSVRQLEAVLKSTKQVAGLTSNELQKMASAMQSVTTYGDETVMEAQSLLLTFTKIGREAFPEALEATLNVATAMGTDLKSAALQVGKALNDPVLGMTALSRSGIQFTQDQKEVVRQLVETGRVAEAQKIILSELETQFGGSARAARDTMGGALVALQNAWGDLFEVSTPGMQGLQQAVESLTATISSPEFQASVQKFGAMLFGAIDKAAQGFALFMEQVDRFMEWYEGPKAGPNTELDNNARFNARTELIEKLSRLQSGIGGGAANMPVYGFLKDFKWPTANAATPATPPLASVTAGAKKAATAMKPLVDTMKEAVDETSKLDDVSRSAFSQIGSSIRGLIDGSKSWLDVLTDILSSIGRMAFQNTNFGGGLGGNILQGLFGGLFGFAKGGTILPGGTGGIDSQLVAFRKSPNERVDITKPGQTLTSGGGDSTVKIMLSPGLEAQILEQANRNAVQIVQPLAKSVANASRKSDRSRY